jgi:hypothetical protein
MLLLALAALVCRTVSDRLQRRDSSAYTLIAGGGWILITPPPGWGLS